MHQMYVITESGGSYDDAWSASRFVTDDLVKGQAFVDEQMVLVRAIEAAKDSMAEYSKNWELSNPRPVIPMPKYDIPRWPSNVKVTQDMRDARKQLEDMNTAAFEEAVKPYRAWQTAFGAVRSEFLATLPKEVAESITDETSYWEIEPIEMLL